MCSSSRKTSPRMPPSLSLFAAAALAAASGSRRSCLGFSMVVSLTKGTCSTYLLRKRRHSRRRPMTVIVGLVCKDGLVIAADTQESDEEDGMKRLDVKKIYDSN